MAQFYRRMGSQLTLLTDAAQLAPREDPDTASVLLQAFDDEGIVVHLNAEVVRVAHAGDGVALHLADGSAISGSDLFLATGRVPNLDRLRLETVGLDVPTGASIEVDEHSATSVAGLYAAGDVRGGAQFTHTAYDDFLVLRSRFLADGTHTTRRVTPYAMFTEPELGRVGETEAQARAHTPDARVARRDFAEFGKAREIGQTRGFAKLVATPDGKRLLGATILGDSAAELVHEMAAIMNADVDLLPFRYGVHIHPTLAEGVHQALAALCSD